MKTKNPNHQITLGLVLVFFLIVLSPTAYAVVKNVQITDTSGKSLPNTRVTIVFPDGTSSEEESDDDGILIFDFPSDGDYELNYSGGRQTVTVTGATAAVPAMSDAVPASSNGWYAGVALGYMDHGDLLSANNDGSLSNINSDDSDLGWSVAGGYLFNDYVGLEVAYLDLGEPDFTATSDGSGDSWVAGDVSTKLEADGWLFAVIGRFPMTKRFALIGRVGAYVWETTETFTENGEVFKDKNDGTDVYYGLGIEYDVGTPDKWVLRGDLARTEVDDDGDAVNMATASVVRKF